MKVPNSTENYIMSKILLLSKYTRKGASTRLRTMQYIPYLKSYGFEVRQHSLFDDLYLNNLYTKQPESKLKLLGFFLSRIKILLTCKQYDLLWIEYELLPYFPAFFERLLRLFNIKYVVDYDDAIFHNYDLSVNPLIRRYLPRKIDAVMKNASAVVCGNQYLMERAKAAGAIEVFYLPTVVDYERYIPRVDKSKNIITVGWIGSPSTQKYITGLAPVLRRLTAIHSIKVSIVGANPDVLDFFSGVNVEVTPWSEALEATYIQAFDIGLMPLIDGPWEKGKCGYKLIQYMACGVPVIASPVGVNVDIVEGNGCGNLADTNEEFFNCLNDLIEKNSQRMEMGRLGRKAVVEHYSLQAQSPKLTELFSSIIKKK